MSSSVLFVLCAWLLLCGVSMRVTNEEHSASEDVPALIQRELLTSATCKVNPVNGQAPFSNPSGVAMALVYLDGTNANEKHDPDFGNSSDVKADGNWAMKWCKAVFGATSYPISPSNADLVTAMQSLCENKGSDEACYFGMYRPVDDVTASNSESVCGTLQDHDGSFSFDPEELDQVHPNGLDGSWTNPTVQPTCQWYDSTHSLYESDPNREYEQCLEWRPSSGRYHMQSCTRARHIICKHIDTTCNTPPGSPFPLS